MKQLAVLNLVLRVSGLVLVLLGLMGLREWSGEYPGLLYQWTHDLAAVRGITLACLFFGVLDLYLPRHLNGIAERARQRSQDAGSSEQGNRPGE